MDDIKKERDEFNLFTIDLKKSKNEFKDILLNEEHYLNNIIEISIDI